MKVSKKAVAEAIRTLHRAGFIKWEREGDALDGTAMFALNESNGWIYLVAFDPNISADVDGNSVGLGRISGDLREYYFATIHPEEEANAAAAGR
jgi:hypothetical protein